MPWVRFDDQFSIHRKVSRLSDAAFRLHVSAVFWCARNLTDGVVPEEDLEDVCARVRTPERFVAELLSRGLWHEAGAACDSPKCPAPTHDGWAIHDYLEFQPSKDTVAKDRESNARRQKAWRDRKLQGSYAKPERNGVTNGASHGVTNTAPTRPDPPPTEERVGGAPASHGGARPRPTTPHSPPADSWDEDPHALAAVEQEIRAAADANVRAIEELGDRTRRGAAAARAALRRPPSETA